MEHPVLEVRNLKKSFGNSEVLKGIGFTLKSGQVLVIIGSSGSGKTTLLRCLNFLETADEGEILVNGECVYRAGQKYSSAELRDGVLHFGLVFQSFNLFPQYTALRNVTLAKDLIETERLRERMKGRSRREFTAEKKRIVRENEARGRELLASVGLADKAGHYPFQLSGGQSQRVAIARSLAMSPDILCFDEPTSALDPELTGEVLKVIRDLKSTGCTMVVVTHEMEFARGVGDRILFMANGAIEEEGTPEEVFGNPRSEKTRAFLSKSNLKA